MGKSTKPSFSLVTFAKFPEGRKMISGREKDVIAQGVDCTTFGEAMKIRALREINKKNRYFRVLTYVYLPLQILNIHFALTLCWSTSTFRKTKFGYLTDNSAKKGPMKWQGPHQVAVKSTTTYIQCIRELS